jgi:hypothetical protein
MTSRSSGRPGFDGLGADFPDGESGLAGLVADGRAMRTRTVLELPSESLPVPSGPGVGVPDSAAALLAELGAYGS